MKFTKRYENAVFSERDREREREVVTNSISFHGMRLTIPLYIIPFRRQCLKVHRIMILSTPVISS